MEKLTKAEVFIGLTGTLIQNEQSEFWWIMNMIENGVLDTSEEFKVNRVCDEPRNSRSFLTSKPTQCKLNNPSSGELISYTPGTSARVLRGVC